MKFSPIKTIALAIAAFGLCGASAYADTVREVKCTSGRTVPASGTESDAEACLKIGSRPTGEARKPGGTSLSSKRSPADEQKAKKYQQLAATHKPRTAQQEQLIKQYMRLPPPQRMGFKAANPGVQKSIWDLGPYAVCFYASVAGGADVVDAGDECHAKWVE